MRISRVIVPWLFLLGLAAHSATAQETTDKLKVTLSNCDHSEAPATFKLIALGKDTQPLTGQWAKLAEDCTWLFTSSQKFSTNVKFSLRVEKVARTTCKRSVWDDANHYAVVSFLLSRKVLSIVLRPDDLGTTDYERRLRHKGEDLECKETGQLSGGINDFTLYNAQLELESIHLPKFVSEKDDCGVSVNRLRPVQEAQKKRRIGNVDDEYVADAVGAQANAGENCHPPVLSGTLIDIIDKTAKHRKIHVEAN